MDHEEHKTKKSKHSIISNHLFEPDFQETFYKHWHDRTPIKTNNLEVIIEPFRVCKITNFIKSEEFMDEVKNELLDVKTRRNSMDLFQFEQSNDLANVCRTNIKTLYKTFQTDMANWMEKNTNIELNKTISMSSSCYSDTDYLLCHDDNLGDRRIAYILYLSKKWTEEDGGALDLFDSDEDGQPRNIVKSLIPEYNSLVFFEVVDNSYHQVAEVTSSERSRWSINGWFHGPLVERENIKRSLPPVSFVEPELTEIDLNLWISKVYLYPGIIKEIQEDVEQDSFAFLSDFLKTDVYESLSREMESENIKWKRVGPADLRNYEIAEEDSLPEILQDFIKLLKSITIFQLLKNYTELDLVPEKETMNPKMTIELQRWSKGCYTLIAGKYDNEESATKLVSDNKKPSSSSIKTEGNESEEECSPSKIMKLEEPNSSSRKICEEADCNTPPSSVGEDDEDDATKCTSRERTPRSKKKNLQTSPAKAEFTPQRNRRNSDTDDSDVSDIGDYLSDPLDCSFDCSEQEDDEPEAEEVGNLDVIMQFHTGQTSEEETIDYVDTRKEEGALIHVPSKDNHLCLVYKTGGTSRVHKYVNHYCRGYFYNLVCTYYE